MPKGPYLEYELKITFIKDIAIHIGRVHSLNIFAIGNGIYSLDESKIVELPTASGNIIELLKANSKHIGNVLYSVPKPHQESKDVYLFQHYRSNGKRVLYIPGSEIKGTLVTAFLLGINERTLKRIKRIEKKGTKRKRTRFEIPPKNLEPIGALLRLVDIPICEHNGRDDEGCTPITFPKDKFERVFALVKRKGGYDIHELIIPRDTFTIKTTLMVDKHRFAYYSTHEKDKLADVRTAEDVVKKIKDGLNELEIRLRSVRVSVRPNAGLGYGAGNATKIVDKRKRYSRPKPKRYDEDGSERYMGLIRLDINEK